jgi:hypothetical protein
MFKARAAATHSPTSGTSEGAYAQTPRITPAPSTRKVVRAATSCNPRCSKPMPKARTASPFQSERRPKLRSSACVHATCVHGESREMPTGWTPAASKSALLSRRSSSSFVQVADQSNR